MKAWRLHAKEELTLDELPVQTVGENCVKFKTLAAGLSLTDLLMYEGKVPFGSEPHIIGRQCVGLVTEVGSLVSGFARGDRVAVDPFVPCKNCPPCKANRHDECEKMTCRGVDDDGLMSDFNVVSASMLHKIPERIKDSDAVLIEYVALGINTVNKLKLDKGEYIVIVGANAIGLCLAQVALYSQAVPILVDMDAERLALAKELGVYYTINSVESDPVKKIFALTGGRMAETVAFINSSQMAFGRCLDYAAVGGRVAIVGWASAADELSGNFGGVLRRQLKVVGVNNGAKLFPSAINLLATRTVDVSRLISAEVKFSEIQEFVSEHAKEVNRYLKVVVKP